MDSLNPSYESLTTNGIELFSQVKNKSKLFSAFCKPTRNISRNKSSYNVYAPKLKYMKQSTECHTIMEMNKSLCCEPLYCVRLNCA